MVVSCKQMRHICSTVILSLAVLASTGQADVRPLTDEEMEEIVAANLPVVSPDKINAEFSSQIAELVQTITGIINTGISSALDSQGGLVHINALNSTANVQINFTIGDQQAGTSIYQSNTYNPTNNR